MSEFYAHPTGMLGVPARVTALLPDPGDTPTHWYTEFYGIHWPPTYRARAVEIGFSPCHETESTYVLRIPYVQGGTKILADIVDDVIVGNLLSNMRDPITGFITSTAHITTVPPYPDCADQDDNFLLKFWERNAYLEFPFIDHFLWETPPPTDDSDSTAGEVVLRGWTEEIADDELKILYTEARDEKRRRETGGEGASPAWLAELDSDEITELYEDLRNETLKRGRKTPIEEPSM